MDGRKEKLLSLLDKGSTKFSIPVYQRNYSWSTQQCKQLLDDLIDVAKKDRDSHFFGSVVSVVNSERRINEYLVIDGQQRLTTVSLLLLAIYKTLRSNNKSDQLTNREKEIYERYLVDPYADNLETSLKLKPIKKDNDAYEKLFKENTEVIEASNVTINYNYFYNRLNKENIDLGKLYDALHKLEIINIELDSRRDDPQLIFESLNSTGLALEESDKIRNFILMGAEASEQDRLYEDYWSKIEELTQEDLSRFVRDYLSAKTRKTPSMNKVYFAFKDYVKGENLDNEEVLKDLLEYARNYNILVTGDGINNQIKAVIYRLNRLETKVTRPYFLEVLKLYKQEIIDERSLYDIFISIESYIFRRSIVGLPTNSLNKVFLPLNNDIYKRENNYDDYVNKLNYSLLNKSGKAKFPRNPEFIENLSIKQVYLMNNKTVIYMLERFENVNTKEDKDIYRHVDNGDYSIEHIMPQTLTSQWKEELGEDYEAVYERWIHTMANLTLTAYNSSYSNNSFEDKKTRENGFIDSGLRINQYISKFDSWGQDEIEKRDKHLTNQALEIWPDIKTTYEVKDSGVSELILDEENDFTGKKIKAFIYEDQQYNTSNLTDAFTEIIRLLYKQDSSNIVDLANQTKEDGFLSKAFSFDKDDLRMPVKIEDVYAELNYSNNSKIRVLSELFELYDIENSSLSFISQDLEEI